LPLEDYQRSRIQDDDVHGFYLDKALYARDGGRGALEDFLNDIKDVLAPAGHIFFIKSSLTGIDDVECWLSGFGFRIIEAAKIHRFFEDIEAYHAIA